MQQTATFLKLRSAYRQEVSISKQVLGGTFGAGDTIYINSDGKTLTFSKEPFEEVVVAPVEPKAKVEIKEDKKTKEEPKEDEEAGEKEEAKE